MNIEKAIKYLRETKNAKDAKLFYRWVLHEDYRLDVIFPGMSDKKIVSDIIACLSTGEKTAQRNMKRILKFVKSKDSACEMYERFFGKEYNWYGDFIYEPTKKEIVDSVKNCIESGSPYVDFTKFPGYPEDANDPNVYY